MKRIILTILATAMLLPAPPARAWVYNDGDVLLVFRKSGLDIEYDLGSVTNFLGRTNGYTVAVTNWDPSQVTNNVAGSSFINADVALLATGPTNYLTSPEPNTTAYSVDSQGADGLHGIISGVGTGPLIPLAIPSNSPTAYVIDTGGINENSSYDYIVSGGHFGSEIPVLGGASPFKVEQAVPASLDFWQVQVSAVYPNPPPDTLIGVFTVATNGAITFVAGPRHPKITGVTRTGTVSALSFATTVGNTYAVAHTNVLGGALSTWPVDTTTLTGDGYTDTLYHTNSGAVEFYNVTVH